LSIVPDTFPVESNLISTIISLQQILWSEEAACFSETKTQHPLQHVNTLATYEKALCRLLEYSTFPVGQMLEFRKIQAQIQLAQIEQRKK